jgi:alpha-amylase/alpha-mannosidase (GH57 family)
MAGPVLLALVWHMHQPSYRDALTGRTLLPWTRLHATKDYADMVTTLRRHPRVHATFNLTPVLLDQLEAIGSGDADLFLDLARKPAEAVSPEEQRFLARHFFSVNQARMLDPYPRYRELQARCAAAFSTLGPREPRLTPEEVRDLQTWFHLVWVDPEYRSEEPIRSLFAKGRGFTETEKGTLLDWGAALAARVVGVYREAAGAGQIELTTSAYHHPILPLLESTEAPREVSASIPLPNPPFRAPEDAAVHLRRARDSHARRFGAPPPGTWPPEGAVSQAALTLLRATGFAWCASDETVLARALGRPEPGGDRWAGALYRSYHVETENGAIAMVFRDRALSDRIGFTYMEWEPRRAADDFVARVLDCGARARQDGSADPLVTVILDGENCWESYPEDGRAFLEALYGGIEGEAGLIAVTVGEALARQAPTETIRHVPVGSWIAPDLSVWVGNAEKNRAWAELRRARERFQEAVSEGALPSDRLDRAREELLVAEASDWFWWYGDDHQSAHKEEFDTLFRSHLICAYNLLGLPAPAAVRRSLRGAGPEGPNGEQRLPFVAPSLDGRDTHFYEWRNAELYDAASDQGADHRTSGIIRRILFGLNERDLFLRVDGVGSGAKPGSAIALRFLLPRMVEARARLSGAPRGPLAWTPAPEAAPGQAAPDPGEFAAGTLTEIRVPLAALGAGPETVLRWSVALEESGEIAETVPRTGDLTVTTLDADFGTRNWSAT